MYVLGLNYCRQNSMRASNKVDIELASSNDFREICFIPILLKGVFGSHKKTRSNFLLIVLTAQGRSFRLTQTSQLTSITRDAGGVNDIGSLIHSHTYTVAS